MQQINIFDMLYDKYKITKPIRMIELFAGYGSQSLSMRYLGVDFEHYRICEWATKSIQAYNDLHIRDYTDYSQGMRAEEVVDKLFNYGISMNYNEPMTFDQIKRKGEKWCREVYNNIIATHNLVNIASAKAKDLNIVDTDKFEYIMTYSFPCQDLSLAGRLGGMSKDSGTRSGMLWQVERLLEECQELGELPQCLLMENVPQVIGNGNIEDFKEWMKKLEILGYTNYVEVLNAKNFGIPQNRERCFMVSILGENNYKMPKNMPLKYRLKILLEKEVDEKYYLSEKLLNCFMSEGTGKFPRRERFLQSVKATNDKGIAGTISCLAGNRSTDNFIIMPEAAKKGYTEAYEGDGVYINRPHQKRGVVQEGMIQTLKTSPDVGVVVKVGNYSPSGHDAASIVDGSGIAPTVMENHGTVTAVVEKYVGTIDYAQSDTFRPTIESRVKINNDVSGTLLQTGNQNGIIEIANPKLIGGFGEKKSNGGTQFYQQDRVYDSESVAMCHPASIPGGSYYYQVKEKRKSCYNCKHFCYDTFCGFNNPMCSKYGSLYDKENIPNNCQDYEEAPKIEYQDFTNLKIRKLTPKECFRLMGVKDEDFDKVALKQSQSSLYHLAGDSIVTTPLMAMFGELLGIDYEKKIIELVEELKENET